MTGETPVRDEGVEGIKKSKKVCDMQHSIGNFTSLFLAIAERVHLSLPSLSLTHPYLPTSSLCVSTYARS